MRNFENKVAVVTGGAAGIGLAVGRELANAGCLVTLMDFRLEPLEAAQKALNDEGTKVDIAHLDVADKKHVDQAAEKIGEKFGRIDILVNNAGVSLRSKKIEEVTEDDWNWLLGVNVLGIMNCSNAFLPYMRVSGEGGHIVNVSSFSGFRVNAARKTTAYAASKYAAVAISEAQEQELADEGIGVSLVAPAAVNTDIYRSWFYKDEVDGQDTTNLIPDAPDDIANGYDPSRIGRQIVHAIENNQFYVFTHPHTRDWAQERMDRIMRAFDDTDAFDTLEQQRMAEG